MTKRINIFLDNQQERLLNILLKKYGGKAPGFFKDLLRDKYDKSFPPYNEGKKVARAIKDLIPEEELTPEQLCEQIHGGRVIKSPDGSMKCEYREGAFKTTAPLSMVGTKDCDPKEINKINEALDKKNKKKK